MPRLREERAIPFNRPYAKPKRGGAEPVRESWWTTYATGQRDGAALNAEAWRRFPGTTQRGPLLSRWRYES